MKNNCTRCEKELTSKYDFGLCYECKKTTKKVETLIFCGIIVVGLLILFGIRYAWAKLVYDDVRCVWAECRIQKD